jgi:hypothetical protein
MASSSFISPSDCSATKWRTARIGTYPDLPRRTKFTLGRRLTLDVPLPLRLELDPDWLNAGALGVIGHLLPEGFEDRLRSESFGTGLIVSVLSRPDLLRLKLFAASDEGLAGVHFSDLCAMRPTTEELADAHAWVASRFPPGPLPELDEVTARLREAVDG